MPWTIVLLVSSCLVSTGAVLYCAIAHRQMALLRGKIDVLQSSALDIGRATSKEFQERHHIIVDATKRMDDFKERLDKLEERFDVCLNKALEAVSEARAGNSLLLETDKFARTSDHEDLQERIARHATVLEALRKSVQEQYVSLEARVEKSFQSIGDAVDQLARAALGSKPSYSPAARKTKKGMNGSRRTARA